jgi:hypothetical protein
MEGTFMSFFLLFDTQCPSCTRVAKQLDRLGVRDLEVRSLHDPELAEHFASAGLPAPAGPALVRVEAGSIKVWTGFGMRMRLARLLGFRRATAIVGLVLAEAKARKDRHDGSTTQVTRRRLLGGTAAAGLGALVFGVARPAAAGESGAVVTPLDAQARRRVLANPAVVTGRNVWGEVDEAGISTVTAEGETVVVLLHQGSRAITVVGTEDGAFALTMVPDPGTRSLRYYLPSGSPIAEQTVQGSTVDTHVLTESPHQPPVEPEGVKEFTTCMVGCLNAADISAECLGSCLSCATGSILGCVNCGLCAGPKAYRCVQQCKDFL